MAIYNNEIDANVTMWENEETKERKTKKQPQPFKYLGHEFTPIEKLKGNFNEKTRKVWGGFETLAPLDFINTNGYDHSQFYAEAKKYGCGKIDVFELYGEMVIPCNKLMYYGQPKWATALLK